ncbi:acylphosphatase-1-like [Diorhabda carinulata]|uniref:acylphosphatase-1-like n=1 Tax=Diorhabda carinulata TaxID=1163345 RepID=UPI0025A20A46|nr:acylphosphatase-1-like [Diorhabda carinulata]
MASEKFISVDFEVIGEVKGVLFKEYTAITASSTNVRGWCMNSDNNSISGVLEGCVSNVEVMKHWLKNVGSPKSKVEQVIFTNEIDIEHLTYDSFNILE